MKIQIEYIPHKEHRYETVGDWYFEGDLLHIKVSQMSDERHSLCVALHELIEVMLCQSQHVSQQAADAFDQNYEKERDAGLHDDEDEPGDDPAAPYHQQHVTASVCERAIAQALGIDWNKYAKEIAEL